MKDDKALLITEYIIEERPYHDAYMPITWADCAIRKYINGPFLDNFSKYEKQLIVPTINKMRIITGIKPMAV